MPRYPRAFLPGIPLHIVQRGHNRQPVFVNASDYRYYLQNLMEVKVERNIRLLAYCLMTNHVHLVILPDEDAKAVSKLMRVLAARQTRHVNKLENRSGTLWEGRYKASLIDTDEYLLACCRYVDLNPVRARIVAEPQDYVWSGYQGRTGLTNDPLLDDHCIFSALGPTRTACARSYAEFVKSGIGDDELAFIRQSVQRNQLTGGSRFKATIEARLGRRLSNKAQGRPRKDR